VVNYDDYDDDDDDDDDDYNINGKNDPIKNPITISLIH
jgi:hypothetical protein